MCSTKGKLLGPRLPRWIHLARVHVDLEADCVGCETGRREREKEYYHSGRAALLSIETQTSQIARTACNQHCAKIAVIGI